MGQAGRTVPFPHVLGNDVAGEIVSAKGFDGPRPRHSRDARPGDLVRALPLVPRRPDNFCRQYRILGHRIHGGYAELVKLPRGERGRELPDSIWFEEAAAFPLVFLTAWHMLVAERPCRQAGEDVLVWGAGSGVGMAAVQIAKVLGARVIATAGSRGEARRRPASWAPTQS